MEPRELPKGTKAITYILMPASLFYLFVLPMLTALWPREGGLAGILFAGFMLAQLGLLTFMSAIRVAGSFYGADTRWMFPRALELFAGPRRRTEPTKGVLIVMMFMSFTLCNYAFAVLYIFISNLDPTAFRPAEAMGVVDGIYFSVVTAATVGYGDIAAASTAARLVVIAQISLSLVYVVLLFSACASFLSRASASEGASTTKAENAGTESRGEVEG